MRERPLGIPLVALALLALATLATTYSLATPPLVDFKIPYCAGNALRLGLDPYLIGSLHACQAARHGLPPAFPPEITAPADLPNYALALYAILSLLPYDVAAIVYLACGFVAVAFVARDLKALAGLGTVPIALALALGTLWLFTFLAQPLVFMLLGLVRSAVALERGRPRTAALYASAMMLQPHVGLAVLLSLFVAEPRARVTIAGVVVAFAGVLALQPALTLEYVRDVLPYAAIVHASNFANFGTPWMLHAAGVPPDLAVRIATPLSAAAVVAGSFLARAQARRRAAPALTVLLAPAFALSLGIYTHVQQTSFVLPAAMVLFARSERRSRTAFTALACLAIPWLLAAQSWRFDAPMLVVTLGLARVLALGKRVEIAVYLGTIAFIVAGAIGIDYHPVPPGALTAARATDPALDAQANVDAGNRFERIGRPWILWTLKLPTWIGYAATIAAALGGTPAVPAPQRPAGEEPPGERRFAAG